MQLRVSAKDKWHIVRGFSSVFHYRLFSSISEDEKLLTTALKDNFATASAKQNGIQLSIEILNALKFYDPIFCFQQMANLRITTATDPFSPRTSLLLELRIAI